MHGVRGQHVKRRRLASDMTASLDRFYESTRRIKETKLEADVQMQKNRHLELKMYKLTHASYEMMACLFVNILQNLKKYI